MEKKVNKVPKKQQGGWMDVINQFNPQMMNNINPLLSSFSNAYQAPVAPAKPKASFWQNTNMKRAHQYAVDLKKYNAEKEIYDQSQQILPLLGPMSALFQGQQGYMDYLQKPKDDLTEISGFHGFQKGGLINTTGYTPGTSSMNNPYNVIPGGNITMQNTPFPVFGIANTGEYKVMMPGNNYRFANADYVAEIPIMGLGGFFKKAWNGVKHFGKEVGNVVNDYGVGMLDTLGNTSGLWDVSNDKYKTNFGQSFAPIWTGVGGGIGNAAKSVFGINFGNTNKQSGGYDGSGIYPQYNQTNNKNYNIMDQFNMIAPFLPMFGIGSNYQQGGKIENGPVFTPIQTEKGEFIGSETGDILPVKAKKRHKNMDDDEVTDILPEGSFIFSRTKSSTIDKNKKIKGIDLNEINLGYTPIKYSETESTPSPDEIKFLDFMSKNKFTPADLANKLQKTYKVTDKDDPFSQLSNEQNKMSRIPYLEIIKGLNEIKKPKDNKYQFGGNVFSPQFSQPSNKAIDGIMGYTNPYDLQDKALRKNGLYGPDLLKAPTTLNKNFFNFKEGGEVPKYQAGALIAGLAGPVIDLGLGIYDRYQNNKNVKKTMADIAKYQELANQNAKNTLGIGLGSSLMNYGLQDTGYTFANYDPQISRVNYTGDQIDARLASQMQNSLDANRSLTESAYRNIGSLGLTPGQLSNYMAKLNAQALQNSNAVNAQYNNSIINNLQNRSNLLNQYFDRKALDRQTGYNVMRNNRNVLNSGLTNSFNSLGSNYFNTLSNIEQSSLAAKMAARNRQANFNVNNGLRIGDAALQVGNAVYNNYLQNKNAVQSNGLPSYNNFINNGNYGYNGQIYNKYDTGYQPPVILAPDGSVIRDV